MSVAVVCGDLMFGSRLLELLREHEPRLVSDAAGADAAVVVYEEGAPDPPPGVPSIAVYSHVDVAARDRARAAGYEVVVPRSRFMREGPQLVAGLLSRG